MSDDAKRRKKICFSAETLNSPYLTCSSITLIKQKILKIHNKPISNHHTLLKQVICLNPKVSMAFNIKGFRMWNNLPAGSVYHLLKTSLCNWVYQILHFINFLLSFLKSLFSCCFYSLL